MVKRKRKKVSKSVSRKTNQSPKLDRSEIKRDIEELERRKRSIVSGSGFLGKAKGFLQRASIGAEINKRKQAYLAPEKLETLKRQVEIEKTRNELAELRQKRINPINVGFQESTPKKQINFRDLI